MDNMAQGYVLGFGKGDRFRHFVTLTTFSLLLFKDMGAKQPQKSYKSYKPMQQKLGYVVWRYVGKYLV